MAEFILGAIAVSPLAFVIGHMFGRRGRDEARAAAFSVRLWLARFRPALEGWFAVHPMGCDRCDAELFELQAALNDVPEPKA